MPKIATLEEFYNKEEYNYDNRFHTVNMRSIF